MGCGARVDRRDRAERPAAVTASLFDFHAEDWRHFAACRGVGADAMHAVDEDGAGLALSYCRGCVVVAECRDYAEAHRVAKWGTGGGQCWLPFKGVWSVPAA